MKSILPNLSQYKIVLGSNSPRRRELLAGLDIDFEVQTIPDIDESFPKTLRSDEVPVYIAKEKGGSLHLFHVGRRIVDHCRYDCVDFQ